MFKAVVIMLDGTERHIEVCPVERDGCNLAPPLTLDIVGAKYIGKGTGEPAIYVQQSL